MKKYSKALLSILLITMIISFSIISVHANIAEPPLVGDVDRDFDVTILDATMIQRFLAAITEPDSLDLALADADADGEMTIIDATAIQRHLASLPTTYQMRPLMDYYLGDIIFHSDIEIMSSGHYHGDEVAYVGIPVNFTVRERWGAQNHRYSLIVDGEKIKETEISDTDSHNLSYTFSQEGIYTVTTRIENCYGRTSEYTREIKVIDMTDDNIPIIAGAVFYDASWMSSGSGVLTVHAEGGEAPYMYNYEMFYTDLDENDVDPVMDSAGYSTGFIPDNEIDIDTLTAELDPPLYDSFAVPSIQITVRDANGNLSVPVTVRYYSYEVLL